MTTVKTILLVSVLVVATYGQPSVVFPLHQSNRWHIFHWERETFIARYVVKDTVMSNGKSYSVVVDSLSFGDSRTYFYRFTQDSVLQYGLVTPNQEQLLFQFSRSIGDTINRIPHGNSTAYIILTGKVLTTVFGSPRWQWRFTFDNSNAWDDETYYTVTDGIGITRAWGFGWEDEVRGAIINGVVHGVLTHNVEQTSLPIELVLAQNFPNPFNPSTSIMFQLPQQSHINLSVYDLLGRQVEVLVDKTMGGGTHRVNFNAAEYSAGIYFYRFIVGGSIQTRKMIIEK